MSMPSEQEMREAITLRDKSHDGRFYYGVITTRVFCQPSCSSRPAKSENLRFFPGTSAAIIAGFRPCKKCLPNEGPAGVSRLVEMAQYIEMHALETLTLASLAEVVGLSPSRLQRLFKAAFGVSPKAYQDAIRMQYFKKALKEGEGVTDAIYSSGFGSLSRVYGEASRNMGMRPSVYRSGGIGEVISYACRETVLGLMAMAATETGICFVQFGEDESTLLAMLREEFPNADISLSSAQNAPELDTWIKALEQHISEGAPRPDLPIDMRGTAFQMKVWRFLLSIREGDVLSYSQLAQQMDQPKAVRAVATACAKNRIAVLIPCHRVLRADGGLGGYRWGIDKKKMLLEREALIGEEH